MTLSLAFTIFMWVLVIMASILVAGIILSALSILIAVVIGALAEKVMK